MVENVGINRKCPWCNVDLDFQDYLSANPDKTTEELTSHWNNDKNKIFCCYCYEDGIPEKLVDVLEKIGVPREKWNGRGNYTITINLVCHALNFDEKHSLLALLERSMTNFLTFNKEAPRFEIPSLSISEIENSLELMEKT